MYKYFQFGSCGAAQERAVRQAGSRKPVHVERGSRQVDHEGAEVTQQGHPRQTGADPPPRPGPQERHEPGEQARRTDQGTVEDTHTHNISFEVFAFDCFPFKYTVS